MTPGRVDGNGARRPVTVEIAVQAGDWPDTDHLAKLAESAINTSCDLLEWPADKRCELSLVFMDDDGIAALNRQWRKKPGATNVLSFPSAAMPGSLTVGDIVLASGTVRREAELEKKPLDHHILHLIVHGFLHLCGYDHENETDARRMETLETSILERLDVADPYEL